MIRFHNARLAGAAVAAAALGVPASALAHPAVYESNAPVACAAPGPAGSYTAAQFLTTCTEQTRYVFTNHGNTYLLRESNDKTTGGAISYAHRPGGPAVGVTVPPTPPNPGLRDASDFNIFDSFPQGPTTGAQPHATCDVPALTTEAVIRSWQGTDPFYAYVPFQRTPVGVDDQGAAAAWISVVKSATAVDLNAVANTEAAREAACEALPGATYAPADATQNTLVSWSAGQVHLATEPLEAKIAADATRIAADATKIAADQAQITALNAGGAQGATQLGAMQSEIAALKLDLRALKLSLPATLPSRATLGTDGLGLTLAGPANRTVRVRMMISAVKAKQLRLRSRILGSQSVALDAAGTATFTLKASSKAVTGLKKAKGTLEIAVDAATGDRFNIVSARLGR